MSEKCEKGVGGEKRSVVRSSESAREFSRQRILISSEKTISWTEEKKGFFSLVSSIWSPSLFLHLDGHLWMSTRTYVTGDICFGPEWPFLNIYIFAIVAWTCWPISYSGFTTNAWMNFPGCLPPWHKNLLFFLFSVFPVYFLLPIILTVTKNLCAFLWQKALLTTTNVLFSFFFTFFFSSRFCSNICWLKWCVFWLTTTSCISHTHTHTHTHIYIYIYICLYILLYLLSFFLSVRLSL